MVSGKEGPSTGENLLFWCERAVCAMRAARNEPTKKVNFRDPISQQLGGCGMAEDESSGVIMPKNCWERVHKHIRAMATCCDLGVTMLERYSDHADVVYILFSRKEK